MQLEHWPVITRNRKLTKSIIPSWTSGFVDTGTEPDLSSQGQLVWYVHNIYTSMPSIM